MPRGDDTEKKKILIIDDEVSITELIKSSLERTGKYIVRTENKGSNGLVAAMEFRPDLILLDILMPDMEGSNVAAQIKRYNELRDIPIVFLTAVISREEANARGGVIGGHPFIAKPVSIGELIDCIERNIPNY